MFLTRKDITSCKISFALSLGTMPFLCTKDIVNTFPKEETPKEHAQAGIGFGIK